MLRMRNCRQRPPSADKARTVNKTLEPELGSQWRRKRPREPHVTARGSPESERSRRAGPTYGRSPYPPATTSPRRVLSPLLPRARRRGSGPAAPRRTARARGGRSPARRRGRACGARAHVCRELRDVDAHVAAHAVVEVDAEAVTAPAHVAEGAVERVRAGVVEVPAVAAVVARLRRRADGAAPADGPARAAGAAGHLRHLSLIHISEPTRPY